jgi:hypothetical protein
MGRLRCRESGVRVKQREHVARAIYYAQGWTLWPMDSLDPKRDAGKICEGYYKLADAAIKAVNESTYNLAIPNDNMPEHPIKPFDSKAYMKANRER